MGLGNTNPSSIITSFLPSPPLSGLVNGPLSTVTLEEFGAVGDGVTDDTAAFQAAANEGAVCITGGHKTYLISSAVTVAAGNYWDLWGITVTTTSITSPVFTGGATDGVTFAKGFTLMGGTLVGSGIGASSNRSGLNLLQWTDIRVIGTEFYNFTDNCTMFRNCTRVMVAFTCAHDSCHSAGQNVHNVTDFVPTGLNQSTLEAVFIGNITYGNIPTACAAVNATYGGYQNIDAVFSFNVLETNNGIACIFSEINSYNSGAGESFNRRVIVSDNVLINNSTGSSATCFYAVDDGPNPFNDPLKLADHQVDNNIMVCASNSAANSGGGVMQFAGSRFSITNNEIIAAGTNGRCILFHPPSSTDPAVYSDVQFANNNLYQTNSGATSRMVELNGASSGGLTRVHWSGGSLVSAATSSTGADGFWIGGSGVSNCTIEGVHIESPGNNGINTISPTNLRLRNLTIHNANGGNSGSTSQSSGILAQGTAAGTVNEITNVLVYDDRGTHQMKYGFQPGSGGTGWTVHRLTIRGALTAPMNAITGISSISAYESDVMTGYGFNSSVGNTAGASPFTIGPFAYDCTYMQRAINGQTQLQHSRNSSNLLNANGTSLLLRRGETLTSTWATTAPTYDLIPAP